MERRLDQLLGTQAVGVEDASAEATEPSEEATTVTDAEAIDAPVGSQSVSAGSSVSEPPSMIADAAELLVDDAGSTEVVVANLHLETMPERSSVRRRTPAPTAARHPSSNIPRATASDGKALPRAYVAKRRTPPAGLLTVGPLPEHEATTGPTQRDDTPAVVDASLPRGTVEAAADDAASAAPDLTIARGAPVPTALPANVPVVTASVAHVPPNGKVAEPAPTAERKHQGGTAAAAAPNPGAFVILLLALIALAIFVLRALG
jgi:hypothetical protein